MSKPSALTDSETPVIVRVAGNVVFCFVGTIKMLQYVHVSGCEFFFETTLKGNEYSENKNQNQSSHMKEIVSCFQMNSDK
jgi:hypothetical protein